MVVDDSITMRKVTSRVLERHEYEVSTAKDGVDALEKLHERVPDLMLLDIEMPRMDGYELATHMKADPRLRGAARREYGIKRLVQPFFQRTGAERLVLRGAHTGIRRGRGPIH